MAEATIYEKKNHIAVLTMNRPEAMNAMNAPMRKEMGEAFTDFRDDNDSWVLIITGAGDRAFSAGMDLKEMAARLAGGRSEVGDEARPASLMEGNIEIWKPIIAAINGVAVGGGLETALACDIRIAAEGARMGMAEPKRGIIPGGGGMARLPRLVPRGMALEILLTGDFITSQEAYRIGLVNQVVPAAELENTVNAMIKRLIYKGAVALAHTKKSINAAMEMGVEEALENEGRLFSDLFRTEDACEGAQAFLEKRRPQFKGK